MERRGAFDYILLETTGLADPGNIAPLFWLDDGLGSSIYLDGVVTLVDAKNILKSLDETPPPPDPSTTAAGAEETKANGDDLTTTAHLQISHADVILLSKTDLVSAADLDAVKARIRGINGLARILVSERGKVGGVELLEGAVLDLHAYQGVGIEDVGFEGKGRSLLDPVGFYHPGVHVWINAKRLIDHIDTRLACPSSFEPFGCHAVRCLVALSMLGLCAPFRLFCHFITRIHRLLFLLIF